ncbi:MAG TPA: histidine phosphatase family protein [Rhizobiaceae bacterium]
MRHLLLLRHAKSSWDDPSLADFDRPLASRGRDAAPLMGRELLRRGWLPGLALVSPAERTRQTWELVAAELADAPPASFPDRLYEASAQALLTEVRRTAESVRALLLIGHNPGLEDFAKLLAGDGSDASALARLHRKFPTAALARFKLDGSWAGLDAGAARLSHVLRPKDLD